MATDLPGILIVDDNEDNRYTLQLLLETDGHERIVCAASGKEAIALIEKDNPDWNDLYPEIAGPL